MTYVAGAVLMAIAVAGCGPTLTDSGQRVQYVMREEAPRSCEYVAEVESGSRFAPPSSVADLKIELRNAVAEEGGNFLVIDTVEQRHNKYGAYYEGTGRAYSCDRPG